MPMTCDELEMRDRLPAWVRRYEPLSTAEAEAIATHVARCTDCAAEVLVLRAIDDEIRAATPMVDSARIVSAIPRRPAGARLTVQVGGAVTPARVESRPRWASRASLLAAATVLLMLGVSVTRERSSPMGEVTSGPSAETTVVAELAFDGVSELSDEALAILLDEMAALPAAPVAEPRAIVRPIIDAQEMP
jgi:hypothetical protein